MHNNSSRTLELRHADAVQLESNTMSERFLRLRAVEDLTGLKRSTIYALAKAGAFPRPFKIGARCSAWSEEAVREWMRTKGPASQRVAA